MVATVNQNISGVGTASGEYCLAVGGTPIGIAPTGTVGANGALTLGTALPIIFSDGLYLYFPVGALFAASPAGFYWCVMSSTTAGTAFNNSTAGGQPVIPSSPTAIVDAGPGAFTGNLVTQSAVTITIPGKSMGRNGQIEWNYELAYTNSAGTKAINVQFGGLSQYISTFTTTARVSMCGRYRNLASEARGVSIGNSEATLTTTTAATAFAVNTAIDRNLVFGIQLATASTDFIIIMNYQVTLRPGYA